MNGRPRLTAVQAVQRNLALALIPVVVLVAIAAAIGVARKPVYSSEAQLNVGGVNLSIQSIPGYAVATAQLAVAYSRSLYATPVVTRVARKTGLSPGAVLGSMTATPVEQTPVIRLRGTGATPDQAQLVANTAADALIRYAAALNGNNPDTPRLRRLYLADSERLRAANDDVNRLSGAARNRAESRADVALLEQRTNALLYQQSKAGDASTSLVLKLAPASPAKSDRASVFQRLLLGALIGGIIIGVGLAIARENALSRRRLALQ
jgi:hypothetical protein